MAVWKTGRRSGCHYPKDRPRHRRIQDEPLEYCDGVVIAPEVSADEVYPQAKSVRQIRKRAQLLKSGSYQGATIVYPLSEAEKKLLNSMGSPAVAVE